MHQRQVLALVAQRLGAGAEGLRTPCIGAVRGDVVHPAREFLHRLACQRQQWRARGSLFGQHGVEQLLHRPGCLAKLVQAHHARTALERVESAPQGREMLQIARLNLQVRHGLQPVGHDFAGLLQEDIEQVVFIRLFVTRGQWLRAAGRVGRLGKPDQRLSTGGGIVLDHGLRGLARGTRHAGLFGQRRLIRQGSKLLAQVDQTQPPLHAVDHALHALADGLRLVA